MLKKTATWMTNIGNEKGEILNSVLTTGEGAGLQSLCQGIVRRYNEANEAPPELIYVDRDCCNASGTPPVFTLFKPWKCHVRLDIWHFMCRFNPGLTTEIHPLYSTWCAKLSCAIFEWDRDDMVRLQKAKKADLKKSQGREPSDKEVLSSLTSAEMAKHCRRRTRGADETGQLIDQLIKSMWNLTDSTGMNLINHNTMPHVWQVQQKHLGCIQDVTGVALYTKTGTSMKGGETLDVFRCGRGSTSLESFHRHQCNFIPGYRSNAMHTQMYMLEGVSRWNMNRSRQALDVNSTSGTTIYDLRLLSNINTLSTRLFSSKLLPEYQSYGNPTDEKIAVEYLLNQSGKGDLLAVDEECDPDKVSVKINNPEPAEQDIDYEEEDATVYTMVDLPTVNTSPPTESQFPTSFSEHPSPVMSSLSTDMTDPSTSPPTPPSSTSSLTAAKEQRRETHAIDNLALFLVNLRRNRTSLDMDEAINIVSLYNGMSPSDRKMTKFSQKVNKKQPSGRWRVSRSPSGTAPGKQVAERLYMVHGEAAEKPEANRVSECVCLHLSKEYSLPRNRPRDLRGNTITLQQAIVKAYTHIKQVIQDDEYIQTHAPTLVLVTLNNATVSAWLKRREVKSIPGTLLQGVDLPDPIQVANDPLQPALQKPSAPVFHEHSALEFPEPENKEGEVMPKRKRKAPPAPKGKHSAPSAEPQLQNPYQAYQYGWPGWSGWTGWPYNQQFPPNAPAWSQPPPPPPSPSPSSTSSQISAPTAPPSSSSRHRDWRLRKSAQEDDYSTARGEQPKKRYKKRESTIYNCTECGKAKKSESGHTQLDGKWYCPSSGETLDEWKQRIYKCPECGKTRSKDNGHIRHKRFKRNWYCPSSGESLEEWTKRLQSS